MANTRALPLAPKMQRDWIAALHEQVPILQRALECYLVNQAEAGTRQQPIKDAMETLCAFDVAAGSYVVPKGGL